MSRDESDEPRLPEPMWEMLRQDEPDPRAVQAAYLRFAVRRPPPVSPLILLRWLAAGFAAGWGVAFAATGDPFFGAGRRLNPPVELPVVAPSVSVRVKTPRAPEPAPVSAPIPAEPAVPVPEPVTGAPVVGPGLQGVLGERSAADPKWQRAVTALKARDYDAAENALRELETAGAPTDRDAASLAVAQVLLTRGRSVEARARLEQLSATAGSPLVRKKASALLGDMPSIGGRSSGAPPVPH